MYASLRTPSHVAGFLNAPDHSRSEVKVSGLLGAKLKTNEAYCHKLLRRASSLLAHIGLVMQSTHCIRAHT